MKNKGFLYGFSAILLAGCSYDGGDAVVPGPGAGGDKSAGYTVSVGAGDATRAQIEGGTWMWSASDNVGFYIQDASSSSVAASNVKLKSLNTAAATSAEFEGEITETQIRRIAADGTYNYYAYYPYSAANSGTAAAFTIPTEVETSAGNLDVPVFMTASAPGKGPLTYLLDDNTQFFTGEKVNFQFRQALSYMDLYLALNLMSQDIKKITVTSSAGALAGAVSVDVASGAVTAVSGSSNQIVINIPAGINVGSADVRVAVIPQTFPAGATLHFKLESDYNAFEATVDVGGKTFTAGQTHRMGLRTSFYLSFVGCGRNDDSGSFSWKGYDIWGNGRLMSNDYSLWWNYTLGGSGSGNGVMRLWLNTNKTYEAAGIPVKVTVEAKRNGFTSDRNQKLQYGVMASSATDFSGTYFSIPYDVNISGNTGFGTASFNTTLTSDTPCIGLKSTFSSGMYYFFVRSIKIEPTTKP